MGFADFAFSIFATAVVVWGLGVIFARNPVHSVMCLIMAFISTAGLFVLIGAEYLAFLLVVVYVGAVAVLFLFVVMMLDIDFAELRAGYARYLPFGVVVAAALVIEIGVMVTSWSGAPAAQAPVAASDGPNNAEQLGMVLYTEYVHFFQIAGLVLLVAMIGAILLTFRQRQGIKTQDVSRQVGRRREDGVEVVSVPTGKGI
ncbi:NADH dehydrogenase subunit J [Parvularcula bermudensis HTCC2503]|uniref:NADH-quinone oxidoreductase subunit J n=1 Tax=Parvularcula bermudensis (strain ATCC BAA-594 / HTCC2503 / KCTC 12087) TaxID=314260 RepID=E0TDV9_PARBH|nr:NADH-quinone oxidoreductase subunit J [Parvularcula bermudensis]ADM10408.1 NADH dehydrogenase subunit J [Parvularcula bermudensis HTCC2503]